MIGILAGLSILLIWAYVIWWLYKDAGKGPGSGLL